MPALLPVKGELVSKLDSKTAKAGDNVTFETKDSVKTADGTEIPKGSKLTGHVIAAQPSSAGANGNSQVALEIDSVEMQGGKKMAVRSQIQSIGTATSDAAASPMTAPQTAATPNTPAANTPNAASANNRAGSMPAQGTNAEPNAAATNNGPPAAGTVVARNGQIAIATTSIPGVLLANNAPGQQDPRMSKASSILLGAKKDIQLDNGTPVVIALAAAGGQ